MACIEYNGRAVKADAVDLWRALGDAEKKSVTDSGGHPFEVDDIHEVMLPERSQFHLELSCLHKYQRLCLMYP